MPLLQATALAPTVATNNADDFIENTLQSDHHWRLAEDGADFQDTGANASADWAIAYPSSGGGAYSYITNIVGPGRGNPAIYAIQGELGGVQLRGTTNLFSQRLLSAEGTVAFWARQEGGVFNSNALNLLPMVGFSWNTNLPVTSDWFTVTVADNGRVECQASFGGGADFWRWQWTDAATWNNWKRTAGDTWASGDIWAHVCVVKNDDANPPTLYVNGVAMAAPTFTSANSGFGPTPDTGGWWDQFDAKQLARSPSTSEWRVRMNAMHGAIASPILATTAYTAQQVLDLYNSYNPNGSVAHYHQYVAAIRPDFWRPPSPKMNPAGQGTFRGYWNVNIDNTSDRQEFADTFFSANTASSSQTFPDLRDQTGWGNIPFKAIGHRSEGNTSGVTRISIQGSAWDNQITTANGFNQGTFCVIFEMPPDDIPSSPTEEQMIYEHAWNSDPVNRRFRLYCTNTQVILEVSQTAANFYQVALDRPSAVGTINMLTYVQTGNPAAAVNTYWNGQLRDGSDIGTITSGTYDGTQWLDEIADDGIDYTPSWPYTRNFLSWQQGRMRGMIYDVFWTRLQMTGPQVQELYDLAVGNIAVATPPTPYD